MLLSTVDRRPSTVDRRPDVEVLLVATDGRRFEDSSSSA
jgi:hypothetical protein